MGTREVSVISNLSKQHCTQKLTLQLPSGGQDVRQDDKKSERETNARCNIVAVAFYGALPAGGRTEVPPLL